MSTIGSVTGSATSGVLAAVRHLDETATRVAKAGTSQDREVDLARAAVDVVADQADFEANVAVLRTGSRMTGRLLDIMV